MPLASEIAQRLVDQNVGGLPGTTDVTDNTYTVMQGFLPAAPDRVVAVYETGGYPPEVQPEMDYPTFQVRVRTAAWEYSSGRARLELARLALHGVTNTTLNSTAGTAWTYVSILAAGDALAVGLDANNRPEFTLNFEAVRSRTT